MKAKESFIGGKIPSLEETQKIEEANKKLNAHLVEIQTKFEEEIVDGVIQCSAKLGYSINEEMLLDMLQRNNPREVDTSVYGMFKCPTCGNPFLDRRENYCCDCGQKLDWGK